MNRKMQVAALLGATMLSTSVWAQEVDEIIVLSSPFKKAATDVISTTEILTAEDIAGQVNKPIGDVLSGLPGVSSAGFGPAVGQPIIRGLGGYRVDVMQNGMTVGDISNTGGDHANAVSLFDAERIEVLKGPAALRYGAFAATGVVNSFNRHLDGDAENGTDILLDFGDNAGETVTAFYSRQGAFALSGFAHDADDITIPTHAESEIAHEDEGHDEELEDKENEAENTHSEGRGFTLSGHFGSDQTGLALMLSSMEKDYGAPGHAHDDDDEEEEEGEGHSEPSIDFEQQTVHARLMHTPSSGTFDTMQADLVFTTVEQTEVGGEHGEIKYDQDTLHLRGEATASLNDWQSLFGVEYRDAELEAPNADGGHHDGEEEEEESDEHEEHSAYLPNTELTQYGLFAFAERETNGWLTELAFRFDNVELEAEEEHHDEEEEEAYHHEGAQSFDLTNISVGLAHKLDGNLLVGGSVSSTERAPSQVELFANGEHHAVARIEKGLATSEDAISKETSLSTELYIRKAWDKSQLRVAVFNNDYSDFIYLLRDTSLDETEGDETLEGYRFQQGDAELTGYEVAYETGLMLGGRMWDASLSYSSVTGELSNGGNLPTIPADKIGFGLGTSFNAIAVQLDVEQVSDQSDTALGELETDGFTNVDISASWQPPQYEGLTLSAAIRNVTDEEIRHHTSPLKDRLPEPGQDIRLTARYRF